jgi:alpha-D-ribose 1-methylphosphonate 5-triphosphate synthase subunit PhnL
MLTVESLEKKFVSHVLNGKEITGVSPVSFHVPQGKALGLSGPSGTGKSSVLKCIYRTYAASAGRIQLPIGGRRAGRPGRLPDNEVLRLRCSEMGYVTQFLSVLPRVSAVDTMAEPLLSAGVSAGGARVPGPPADRAAAHRPAPPRCLPLHLQRRGEAEGEPGACGHPPSAAAAAR